MRKRPEPVSLESPFNINEIFFSKTNLKGIILDGNEVFYRVSKYEPEEMIGKPHNIVRHPDMPKVIFKLLWEYIQSCRPFSGYVKNMAKDGSYYWVYALVIPVHKNGQKEKYLSIRIKPTSHFFPVIKKLYEKLLKIEKEQGVEASEKELFESLKAMGYENYQSFMIDSMIEEMKEKDDLLDRDIDIYNVKEGLEFLRDIFTHSKKIKKLYDGVYSKVNGFANLEVDLENKFSYIYEITDELSLIALNSSVESYKLGSTGASFFVVSSEIKKDSERIGKLINSLKKDINDLLKIIKESTLYINISKLEVYTVNYFINEVLKFEDQNMEKLIDNITDLLNVMKYAGEKNLELSIKLQDYLKKMVRYIDQIEEIIRELHYIQLNGLVESARLGEQKFSIIFNQVKELVENTTSLIDEINPLIKKALADALEVENVSERVNKEINYSLEVFNNYKNFSKVD